MLHDNGVRMADSMATVTPIQRYVYFVAKDYHTDDVDASAPSSVQQAQNLPRGI